MAWQNKYRPRQMADLHLTIVREKMLRFMAAGKLPAVMLFAGPKGTGKTSTARIIAALLNSPSNADLVKQVFLQGQDQSQSQGQGASATASGKDKKSTQATATTFTEPDLSDDQVVKIFDGHSFLVQEIDAASNSRVEDIRQLQDQIFLPPSMSQVSVFIFDEVHMLSNSAFNALLKTLEEPPSHCIFILATTELHKIPATITSRCSLVEFQKATPAELVAAFQKVLAQENIKADPAALQQIAAAADGSFRDGIKLLEMAALSGEISQASVTQILHTDLSQKLPELLDLIIKQKDEAALVQYFAGLRNQGVDEVHFLKAWLNFLYTQLQLNLKIGAEAGEAPLTNLKIAHFLLQQTSELKVNERQLIPFLSLELKCLELVMKAKKSFEADPLSGGSSGNSGNSGAAGGARGTENSNNSKNSGPEKVPNAAAQVPTPAQRSDQATSGEGQTSVYRPSTLRGEKSLISTSEKNLEINKAPISDLEGTEKVPNEVLNEVPKKSLIENTQIASSSNPTPASDSATTNIKTSWQKIIRSVSDQSQYLAAIFKLAEVQSETATELIIGLGSKFHCDMMKQAKNVNLFQNIMQELGLPQKKIDFALIKNPAATSNAASAASTTSASVQTAGQASASPAGLSGYKTLDAAGGLGGQATSAEAQAVLSALS